MMSKRTLLLGTLVTMALSVLLTMSSADSRATAAPQLSAKSYSQIARTRSGVGEFRSQARVINAELISMRAQNIVATITFDGYLSPSQLADFVSHYQLSPSQVQARFIDDQGLRVTLATKYGPDMSSVPGLAEGEWKGFVDLYVNLNHKQLGAIEQDPLVYCVDTSRDDLVNGGVEGKNPASLTWLREDIALGIIK